MNNLLSVFKKKNKNTHHCPSQGWKKDSRLHSSLILSSSYFIKTAHLSLLPIQDDGGGGGGVGGGVSNQARSKTWAEVKLLRNRESYCQPCCRKH